MFVLIWETQIFLCQLEPIIATSALDQFKDLNFSSMKLRTRAWKVLWLQIC